MALLGYAKAHPTFSLRKQVRLLKQAGCDQIFQDKTANEYSGFYQAVEAYEEGRDVFVTLLHHKNHIFQEQFLAMVELKKLLCLPGRPKEGKSTIRKDEVALKLWQEKLPAKTICDILGISTSTFSRIKKDNMLASVLSPAQTAQSSPTNKSWD